MAGREGSGHKGRDEPAFLRYTDRRLGVLYEVIRRTLEAGDGAVDVLCLGEDLGTQLGPMISVDLYRGHLRPRLAARLGRPHHRGAFVVSPRTFRRLRPATRKAFRKHTPPIVHLAER